MKCGLIGSGNVAHALGRRFEEAVGWVGQWSRSGVAAVPGVPVEQDWRNWEVAVLAVCDDALEAVGALVPTGVWRVHLSGAKPLADVVSAGERGAVMWPVCSIRRERPPDWNGVHWAVEASDDEVGDWAIATVTALGGVAHRLTEKERLKAHVAAVFAANFTNLALAEAADLVAETPLPWAALHGLASGVFDRAESADGARLITGPAARGDEATLAAHRATLEERPDLASLYDAWTRRIQTRP